jgi:hypothetical protein
MSRGKLEKYEDVLYIVLKISFVVSEFSAMKSHKLVQPLSENFGFGINLSFPIILLYQTNHSIVLYCKVLGNLDQR